MSADHVLKLIFLVSTSGFSFCLILDFESSFQSVVFSCFHVADIYCGVTGLSCDLFFL